MSLFGKMIPAEPGMKIPAEVRTVLEEVLVEAGKLSRDDNFCECILEDSYIKLDIFMFFEILTYLPGRHLDEFVKLNDGKRPRWEIDAFLRKNMPNAEEIFAVVIDKLRESYMRKW
jgi:hypothetical protein